MIENDLREVRHALANEERTELEKTVRKFVLESGRQVEDLSLARDMLEADGRAQFVHQVANSTGPEELITPFLWETLADSSAKDNCRVVASVALAERNAPGLEAVLVGDLSSRSSTTRYMATLMLAAIGTPQSRADTLRMLKRRLKSASRRVEPSEVSYLLCHQLRTSESADRLALARFLVSRHDSLQPSEVGFLNLTWPTWADPSPGPPNITALWTWYSTRPSSQEPIPFAYGVPT